MKNLSVQYLRGVAALMIVLFHEYTQLARLGAASTEAWFDWLQAGVDIFFVISGFVMWASASKRRPGRFALDRLVRIVPLYWGITTFTLVLSLIAPRLLQSTRFNPGLTLASYAFVPWPNPSVGGELLPLVVVGWTLNYEIFFYTVFAGCLFLPPAKRLMALTLVLGGLVGTGLFYGGTNKWVLFYTSPHQLEFLLGVSIAAIINQGDQPVSRSRPPSAVLGFGLVAAALTLPIGFTGLKAAGLLGWVWAALAAVIVLCVVALNDPRRAPVRLPLLLGEASYALYLTHPLTLSASGQIFRRLHLEERSGFVPLFIIVSTAGAVIVALLAHRFADEPLRRWLTARSRRAA